MPRLVACESCHRQYDVSAHPEGERIRCLCGESVTVTAPKTHQPRPIKCADCGGHLEPNAAECRFCGGRITLEERRLDSFCPECCARMASDARFCMECGVEIRPQLLAALPIDASCPRCRSALRGREIAEGLEVVECSSCAGIWLTPELFDRVCREAERRGRTGLARPAPTKEPQKHAFRYLPCIVCGDMMVPRNFGATSGVLIDVCRAHGIWLDHRELPRIVAWIESGGKLPEEADQTARRRDETPASAGVLDVGPRRAPTLDAAILETLGDFFGALFD